MQATKLRDNCDLYLTSCNFGLIGDVRHRSPRLPLLVYSARGIAAYRSVRHEHAAPRDASPRALRQLAPPLLLSPYPLRYHSPIGFTLGCTAFRQVEALIEDEEVPVNVADKNRVTALQHACGKGAYDIVKCARFRRPNEVGSSASGSKWP